ncbi:DUF3868 domain-containing protein [Bacteroides sp. GM023]|uniref:DUF3868 domain-containing protein n=1 Tax=Bacteroides sp. GM023 TaxID=2723058 RepID=UPI00168A78C6|nr:DUF3868 domain-containing protein [Bacteroides sp. GM023]MBD3590235.1 DUF3868 domain-containing protein [Bacteroides sp. GM023]
MKKKLIYAALCLAMALPAGAQKYYNDAISITDVSLWQQGESLYIDMQIDMRNLKVDNDRTLTLTPMLVSADRNLVLPEIIINGRRRQKAYVRSMALNSETNLGVPSNKKEVLSYTQVIPYQSWMENASLNLEENLCGCGGHQEVLTQEPIPNEISTEIKRLSAIHPILSHIQLPADRLEVRSKQYEAHLEFPVNQSVILPDYMNNKSELQNIQKMLSETLNDKGLNVKGIYIEGFASPEGALKLNEQLSVKRAEALKNYLTAQGQIPAGLCHVSFGGENWDGLVKALESSTLKEKTTLLDIIEQTSDIALRKQKLKNVNGGAPYRVMLRELYPALRKVNCRVDYTTDISIAAQADAEDTNLNAAATALSERNLTAARQYLDKSNPQTAEYANNNGAYYLLNGQPEQAIIEFNKAIQKGSEAARSNLAEMEKVMKMRKK